MKRFIVGLISATALMLSGCGGEGGNPVQPTACQQLVSIQVAPQVPLARGVSQDQLPVGVSTQYEATLTYCDGSTEVVTDGVTWMASNANATVSANGMVLTVAPGDVDILATLDNLTGVRPLSVSEAVLTELSMTPPTLEVPVGVSEFLRVQGQYDNDTTLDVTDEVSWSVSPPSVASVSAGGEVTGSQAGTATVTATYRGQQTSVDITVTAALLRSLLVTPSAESVPEGVVQLYRAKATYSNGKAYDVTEEASWSSNNAGVAIIQAPGEVLTAAPGKATITARFNGVSDGTELTVTAATLTGVQVTPKDPTLEVGLTRELTATALYDNGTEEDVTGHVSWSSNTPSVASVNDRGQAQALDEGGATITATFGVLSDSSTLTVTKAELEKLVLSESELTLGVGLERALTVTATYTNGYSRLVTAKLAWSSSADEFATVDANGTVYAKRPGVATLTTTLDGITATATVQVTPLGDVVTWGDASYGGNCDGACERPKGVRAIFSNQSAFAAITQDNKVVAWGNTYNGGDTSNAIGAPLDNVKVVVGSQYAFAALRHDGQVATWGYFGSSDPDELDFSALAELNDVVSITANNYAFAALTKTGRVVVWGRKSAGGDNSTLSADLQSDVQAIVGTNVSPNENPYSGFAALKKDGSVVSWGGLPACTACKDLTDVVEVVSTRAAFAARTSKGEVVAWGFSSSGGNTGILTGVVEVVSSINAFAARKHDGSVVAWGFDIDGGDTTEIAAQLKDGVVAIYSAHNGFAAVKEGGAVVSWWEYFESAEVPLLTIPKNIIVLNKKTNRRTTGFAALNSDGTVVSWGSLSEFDSVPLSNQLNDVRALFSTGYAFAALKGGDTVVTWGVGGYGGDSSTPAGGALTGVQTIVGNLQAFAAIVTPQGAPY